METTTETMNIQDIMNIVKITNAGMGKKPNIINEPYKGFGRVTRGLMHNGKTFMARLQGREDDDLIFQIKNGEILRTPVYKVICLEVIA